MQNIITQVSQDEGMSIPIQQVPQQQSDQSEYYEDDAYGNSLIHLNIQENHYYITRDQLMSLPESLLLCLFPSGVFLDRDGQVITNLTPDDEVYIMNFPPDCFEYIMEVFTKAHEDLINFPVEKLFERRTASSSNLVNSAKGFFSFNNNSTAFNNSKSSEHDLLHQKPAIIVLREDLDYYCVPQETFQFESNNYENNDDLLHHFMAQIKLAAGSYLSSKTSIFQGLFSSNRLKYQASPSGKNKGNSSYSDMPFNNKKLGPAEQHLMDMLCSSGFDKTSQWGNRTQEVGKTVISSLSLCRLANESTQEFRDSYELAKNKWEKEHESTRSLPNIEDSNNNLTPSTSALSLNSLRANRSQNNITPIRSSQTTAALGGTLSNNVINSSNKKDGKRRSRLSQFADNVRSHSTSRGSSLVRSNTPSNKPAELPKVYDLVPKPDINSKLLLFWRKPARKCWWGDEEITLDVEIYGDWVDKSRKVIKLKLPTSEEAVDELNKISVPVRLHIRRVWTLELSVIGVQ